MVWPPNLIVLVSNGLKFEDPHREDNFSLTASHPSRAISDFFFFLALPPRLVQGLESKPGP